MAKAKRKTKAVLTDEAKYSRMEDWAKQRKFPEDTAKKIAEKYGMYGYDLMLKALMSPSSLNLPDCRTTDAALHYLLGEDKRGNPAPENTVSIEQLSKIIGKDAAKIEADINNFRTANDIPTQLPVPEQAVQEVKQAQERVENRIDTAHPTSQQKTTTEITVTEAQWIEQELARMKGDKDRELSFDTLRRNGLTNEDMQKALTPDMVKEVHAGPTSQNLAENAPKIDRSMQGNGNCLAAVQYNTCRRDTTEIQYATVAPARLPGNKGNAAANCQLAWENSGKFTVFKFQTDHKNTCLYDPPPCAGSIVNYEQGCALTKDGHVAISDGKGTYYCDFAQNAERFAKGYRRAGQPYGDFYISFTNDCTVSDELARQMLHERYIRENPHAAELQAQQGKTLELTPPTLTVTPEQTDSINISNTNNPVLKALLKSKNVER